MRAAQETRTCTPLTPARGAASIPGAGTSGPVLGPFPGWCWGPGGHFRETVCWSLLGDTLLWRHCLRPSGDPVAASAQRYDPGGSWVGPYLSWASVSASAGWALGGLQCRIQSVLNAGLADLSQFTEIGSCQGHQHPPTPLLWPPHVSEPERGVWDILVSGAGAPAGRGAPAQPTVAQVCRGPPAGGGQWEPRARWRPVGRS